MSATTERRVLSASSLIGDEVYNRENEHLGKIEEIMLDVSDGHVAYAVLSFGGFLGFGNKLFAIPWPAITLDQESQHFILDVEKQRLEEAPGFDKENWPDMSAEEWGVKVYSYYGVIPYWKEGEPPKIRKAA